MIDSAIAALDDETRRVAEGCLATLASLGVFATQIQTEKETLLGGNNDEDPEALAKRILEYRRTTQQLETLQELGLRYFRRQMNHA